MHSEVFTVFVTTSVRRTDLKLKIITSQIYRCYYWSTCDRQYALHNLNNKLAFLHNIYCFFTIFHSQWKYINTKVLLTVFHGVTSHSSCTSWNMTSKNLTLVMYRTLATVCVFCIILYQPCILLLACTTKHKSVTSTPEQNSKWCWNFEYSGWSWFVTLMLNVWILQKIKLIVRQTEWESDAEDEVWSLCSCWHCATEIHIHQSETWLYWWNRNAES